MFGERATAGSIPRLRRMVVVIGMVVLALLASGWWLLRPDALEPVASGVGLEASDDQLRLTSYAVSNKRPIELVSVRPADLPPEGARVTIVACRWRDPSMAFATGAGPLDEHCSETRDVAGLRLEPRRSTPTGDGTFTATREWDVVVAVELGDQPSYVTDGFTVDYREGLRRGRQVTGAQVAVYRPGHEPFQ